MRSHPDAVTAREACAFLLDATRQIAQATDPRTHRVNLAEVDPAVQALVHDAPPTFTAVASTLERLGRDVDTRGLVHGTPLYQGVQRFVSTGQVHLVHALAQRYGAGSVAAALGAFVQSARGNGHTGDRVGGRPVEVPLGVELAVHDHGGYSADLGGLSHLTVTPAFENGIFTRHTLEAYEKEGFARVGNGFAKVEAEPFTDGNRHRVIWLGFLPAHGSDGPRMVFVHGSVRADTQAELDGRGGLLARRFDQKVGRMFGDGVFM